MDRRALPLLLSLAVAAAVGAWLLAGGGGGGEADPAPVRREAAPLANVPSPRHAPDAAAPETLRTGVVAGTVTRRGRPCTATVTATRVREAPDEPDSFEAWERDWIDNARILDLRPGLETTPRAAVEAGPDGVWSFRGLGSGEFHFEARTADGWRGSNGANLGSEGQPVIKPGEVPEPLEIDLAPGPCELRGRALNPDGSPFDGFVLARHGYETFLPVRTDAGGRFVITALPEETVRISALEPGRREIPGPLVILPSGPVEFTVGAEIRELDAVVLAHATGEPIPGARVRLVYLGTEEDGGEILGTDDRGRFPIRFHSTETTRVLVDAAGFASLDEEWFWSGPPPEGPLEFRLRRPARISGRVTTTDGAPAAGAEVALVMEKEVRWSESPAWRTVADGEGGYALADLPPGPALLLVAGGGFVSRNLGGPAPWDRNADVIFLQEGADLRRDLAAVPSARARGSVVDAEGRGKAGVRISVNQGQELMKEGIPVGAGYGSETTTSAEGFFAIPFLFPGFEAVVTTEGEQGDLPPARIPPLASGQEGVVLIQAPPTRTIEILVRSGDAGRPLAGIEVDVEAEIASGWWADAGDEWTTDAGGRVLVGPVPRGTLRIHAGGWDPWWMGSTIDVPESSTGPVVLEVDPLHMPGTEFLDGTVLLPDGTPAAGATVECECAAGWVGFTGEETVTDAEGRFRIRRLHPQEYDVVAELSRPNLDFEGQARARARGGDRGVVITLVDLDRTDAGLDGDETQRILLRAFGPGRAPLRAGDVDAYFLRKDGEGWSSTGRTLIDGLCSIDPPDGSEEERFWLHVTHAESANGSSPAPSHAVFGPFPAAHGTIEVELPAGLTVEGRVTDLDGRGIPRSHVSLLFEGSTGPAGEIDLSCRIADAFADDEGRFVLEGAGEGDYFLVAKSEPGHCGSERIPVRGGAKDLVVPMRSAVSVLVTVLDAGGAPVREAHVVVKQERAFGSYRQSRRTNAAGMVRLEGLDPRVPASLVLRPDGEGRRSETQVKEWMPADTTLRLK